MHITLKYKFNIAEIDAKISINFIDLSYDVLVI
jgi:hypothetical protein